MKDRIAHKLRAAIVEGTTKPGQRVLDERELMERQNVARGTAQAALAVLLREGLIVARPPEGYFVRDRRPLDYRPQLESIPVPRPVPTGVAAGPADAAAAVGLTDATAAGAAVSTGAEAILEPFLADSSAGRVLEAKLDVGIDRPPAEVLERLDLRLDEPAVVRRRMCLLDGEPVLVSDTYLPYSIAQGTVLELDDLGVDVNEVLAELGHAQLRVSDEFRVRLSTPEEAQRLALPAAMPVACHIATGYTAAERAVRVVVGVLPGDRHVIRFERRG